MIILFVIIFLLYLITNYLYKGSIEGIKRTKKRQKKDKCKGRKQFTKKCAKKICKKKFGNKYVLFHRKKRGKKRWYCKQKEINSYTNKNKSCKGKCCEYKDSDNYNVSCDELKEFCGRKMIENNSECLGVGIDCFEKLKEMNC